MRGREVLQKIQKTPDVIIGLRRALGNTETPLVFGVTDVLQDQEYRLNPQQVAILNISLPLAKTHQEASRRLREYDKKLVDTLQPQLEERYGITRDVINGIVSHATSATVCVTEEQLKTLWRKDREEEGLPEQAKLTPGGFTNEKLAVEIEGFPLPISFVDGGFSEETRKLAQHEDKHVQYRYLHPATGEIITHAEYRTILTNQAQEIFRKGDQKAYRRLCSSILNDTLGWYLNELTAYTVQRYSNLYDDFFGEKPDLYNLTLPDTLNAIRGAIDAPFEEKLSWEMIIQEELVTAKAKAQFLANNYQRLFAQKHSPEYIAAVMAGLTVQKGYLAAVYTEQEPSMQDIRRWHKEYRDGGKLQLPHLTIPLWTDALCEVGGLTRHDLTPVDRAFNFFYALYNSDVEKACLDVENGRTEIEDFKVPDPDDLSFLYDEIGCAVEKRLALAQATIAEWQNLPSSLSDKQKERIKSGVLRKAVNIDSLAFDKIDLMLFLLHQWPDNNREKENDTETHQKIAEFRKTKHAEFRNELYRLGLNIEAATDTLYAEAMQGKTPDVRAVMVHDYLNDSAYYEGLLDQLDQYPEDTPGEIVDVPPARSFRRFEKSLQQHTYASFKNEKNLRTYISPWIRLLYWATQHHVQDERLKQVRRFVINLYRKDDFPEFYALLFENKMLGQLSSEIEIAEGKIVFLDGQTNQVTEKDK